MVKQLLILTFHSLDDSGSAISFPPQQFHRVINDLKEKGYRNYSLKDAVEWLRGEKELDSRGVVITFDDGFQSLYTHAFPVLEEAGFHATLFLTTGYCGKQNNWETQPPGLPVLPILTWDQVVEMSQSVFSIQPHTRTHPYLSRLPLKAAKEEILGSKKDIEDRVGKPVDFFCYPYGDDSEALSELIREHFRGACSVRMGILTRQDDPYNLPRIEMYYFGGTLTSGFLTSPAFTPYLAGRQFLRKIRQLM